VCAISAAPTVNAAMTAATQRALNPNSQREATTQLDEE